MDTLETLSTSVVKDFIKERDSKICTITFLKADGSIRKANGLFKPVSHIVGSERGFKQSEHMKEIGLQPFYDLQKKAWISFYLNRVVDLK